jgi:TatD DNase family protein
VITYKNAGLKEVLEKIDLQHLVLETDAPYLTRFLIGVKETKAVI